MRYPTAEEMEQAYRERQRAHRYQPQATTDAERAHKERMAELAARSAEARAEAIQELIESDAWKLTAAPSFRFLRDNIEHKLATGRNISIEEIRRLQGAFDVVDDLIEKPADVFRSALEDVL